MTRRLLLLAGLAILGLTINHSAGWGQIAMFLWTDRYRPVTVPNWDGFATPLHYVFLVLRVFGLFVVPAFLFIAGFFIAYAIRGRDLPSASKIIARRLRSLLIPYLIWSSVIFVADALQGIEFQPVEYLIRLLTLGADPSLYYIPLLCYLTLLSPLIVRAAQVKPRALLMISALIQLIAIVPRYGRLFGWQGSALDLVIRLSPDWSITRWVFFFSLGVVGGVQIKQFKAWLTQHRDGLFTALIGLFLLGILESDLLLRLTKLYWFAGISSLSANLLAVAFVLWFLSLDAVTGRISITLAHLGPRSYGVYLVHPLLMELVARVIRSFAPGLLAYQGVFALIVFVSGLGGSLLMMAAVAKSPVRRAYAYLFG